MHSVKNSFNLNSDNKSISSNKNKEKEEDEYKVTAHFINEDCCKSSIKESKTLKRPSTPNSNRYNHINKEPLTCDNKNMDKYKFNYNFETKKNGVIVPKKDSKISKIQRQNLFKVGYNNNINRNNINKQKAVPSKISQIFGTQENSPKESSLISIRNNIFEKNKDKDKKNKPIINNNNNKRNIKKIKNNSFVGKKPFGRMSRPFSTDNKTMSKRKNFIKTNELNKENGENKKDIKNIGINKEKKRNNSLDKNSAFNCLPDIKISNVKYQLEMELNNIFKNLPEDFEKYPELKSQVELIVQNIHGLKDYIYKNTQNGFRKNKITNLNNNKK